MRYLHLCIAGVVCLAAAGLLSWFHVDEENSPLVLGLAFLGISLIVSPLIFGAARSEEGLGGMRPSGRAVLQAGLFPLVGAGLTVWGLLGAAGILPQVSFDGLRQHCQRCQRTYILEGERRGRLHYSPGCESCIRYPALTSEVEAMMKEICARLQVRSVDTPDPEEDPEAGWRRVRSEIRIEERTPLPVAEGTLPFRIRGVLKDGSVLHPDPMNEAPLEIRVDIEGTLADPIDPTIRAKIRLTLFDLGKNAPLQTVEREGTFPAEPAGG